MPSYAEKVAATIEATNALPLDALAEQRDRFDLAKRVAGEVGSAVVTLLPVVNGRYHARAGLPSVVVLRSGDEYALGYLWAVQEGTE